MECFRLLLDHLAWLEHQFLSDIRCKIYFFSNLRGAFNKVPDFFVHAFKIVVDSWKFTMLLLYILWDVWPIFIMLEHWEMQSTPLLPSLLGPLLLGVIAPDRILSISQMHLFYRLNNFWKAPRKSSCVSVSMTFVTASFISSIVS